VLDIIIKTLKVFADHRLWDEGVELIGSWCFALYQEHLGVRKYPFRTPDIDFLIPQPFRLKKKIDLVKLLGPLGFQLSIDNAGYIYLWSPELKIEFLTPERGRGTAGPKEIKNMGINAIPLRYVDMLFKNPIKLVEQGVAVNIPNPAAYAFHKLLISGRRKKKAKAARDIEQALAILDSFPVAKTVDLYLSFPKPWQKQILRVLGAARKSRPLQVEAIQEIIDTLQNAGKP
jgi:hypothetical protein